MIYHAKFMYYFNLAKAACAEGKAFSFFLAFKSWVNGNSVYLQGIICKKYSKFYINITFSV